MPHRGPDQGGRQELRWCWPRQDSWKPAALVWGLSGEYDPTWVLPPPLTFFRHSWLRLGVRHRGPTESPPRAGHFSFEVTTLLPPCENLFGERAGQTDKAVIWEGVSDKTGPVEGGRGGQSTCCPLLSLLPNRCPWRRRRKGRGWKEGNVGSPPLLGLSQLDLWPSSTGGAQVESWPRPWSCGPPQSLCWCRHPPHRVSEGSLAAFTDSPPTLRVRNLGLRDL